MLVNNFTSNKEYKWICPVCNEEFKTRRLLTKHKLDKKHRKHSNLIKINWKCEFCGREGFSPMSSFNFHRNHCKSNPNGKIIIGHKVTDATKLKISSTAKLNKLSGGYRKGSGKGKKGTYKGYYCDSSWELAYVIYNLDHGISFRRNTERFPYSFDGETHNYIPDFIEGNTYIEIKGFFTEEVFAKSKDFPYKLKYIDKDGIKPYLDYVINKYGEDFIKLYEDKDYKPGIKIQKITCPCCHKKIREDNYLHIMNCYKNKGKTKHKRNKCKDTKLDDIKANQRLLYPNLFTVDGNYLHVTIDEYLRRKDLVLNSGVDMTKFKWKNKVSKITGLSKRIIDGIVNKFPDDFKDVYKDKHVGRKMK